MAENAYLVQCFSGAHVMEVIPGTELERLCKAREKPGALTLNSDECPECITENQERDQRFANMCSFAGCAFGDDTCSDGCFALRAANKTSPYDDQLRGTGYGI